MQSSVRIGVLAIAAVAVGLVLGVRAQEVGTPGQNAEPPAPEFSTEIFGTAPEDIDGRWLTVAHLGLPGEKIINVPGFLVIDVGGAEPVVTRRYVKLPEPQRQALEAANEANQPWTPSPDDLQAIAAAWDTLPADPQSVASVKTDVFSQDAFDETITGNAEMAKAEWAIRQREVFQPGGNRPTNQVMILTAVEKRDDGWTGPYTSVTVAAAPFPIPITFNGTVAMYRLGEAAEEKGFFARLADMFAGCGR